MHNKSHEVDEIVNVVDIRVGFIPGGSGATRGGGSRKVRSNRPPVAIMGNGGLPEAADVPYLEGD